MRVLIVEDNKKLASYIKSILQESCDYCCDISYNGEDGLHFAKTVEYDLVILDLALPVIDGITVLKNIRKLSIRTPVLILTARDSSEDIIRGLDSGGDDYMVKPFDMNELVARCRALLRRSFNTASSVIEFGEICINLNLKQVTYAGNSITLTSMEYKTLEYLAMKRGVVVTKTQLLEHLYDMNWESSSNTIEVFVSALRKKIHPDIIKTVRGHGYCVE